MYRAVMNKHINLLRHVIRVVLFAIIGQPYSTAKTFRLPQCGKFDLQFSHMIRGRFLIGSVLHSIYNMSTLECYHACARHVDCQTVNIGKNKECQLNSKENGDSGVSLLESKHWTYVGSMIDDKQVGPTCHMKNPCIHGDCIDICQSPGFQCRCHAGFAGHLCQEQNQVFRFHDVDSNTASYPHVNFTIDPSTPGLTICAWAKPTQFSAVELIVSLHQLSTPGKYNCNSPILLYRKSRGMLNRVIRWEFDTQHGPDLLVSPSLNEWHHSCISWQHTYTEGGGQDGDIYLDGQWIASIPNPGPMFNPGIEWRLLIGADLDALSVNGSQKCDIGLDASQGFIGDIRHVYIWRRQMNSDEITRIMKFDDLYEDDQLVSWKMLRQQFKGSPIVGLVEKDD